MVVNYVTAMMKELSHHDFWSRLEELGKAAEPCHRLAERLDRDLTRATKHAATKVRR